MIVVVMQANGEGMFFVCDKIEEAQQASESWLKFYNKKYPNKTFTPRYFQAIELEAG